MPGRCFRGRFSFWFAGSSVRAVRPGGWLAISFLLVLVCGVGCNRREQISSYTVPKQTTAAAAAGAPQRMLAALVPHANTAWFFKLMGPDQEVQPLGEPFRQLVRSVRFDAQRGEPAWDLPAGWTARQGSELRFATIAVPVEGKTLELTVIPLGMPDGDTPDYQLSNVNRWRGQLGLPPIAADALPDSVERLELADGEATLVELVGQAGPAMGPPFAGMGSPPAGPASARPPGEGGSAPAGAGDAAGGPGTIRYTTPEGWEPGRVGGIRKAAFVVRDGQQQVEITAIDLAAAAGELLPNINRWRGQIELPDVDQQQLDTHLVPLTIGGLPGHYVELPATGDPDRPKSILGAVVVEGPRAWFFKLMGDTPLAQRERERLQEFLKSIEFTSDNTESP
ncbi:MAG: hypothetical protein J5I93_21625 [Pirellulaceae bacterium]|nr:hypothetical protein [Pirellulaceae bacterium]